MGPVLLSEMIEAGNEAYIKYIPDYRINLVDPFSIATNGFQKFSSHLKENL